MCNMRISKYGITADKFGISSDFTWLLCTEGDWIQVSMTSTSLNPHILLESEQRLSFFSISLLPYLNSIRICMSNIIYWLLLPHGGVMVCVQSKYGNKINNNNHWIQFQPDEGTLKFLLTFVIEILDERTHLNLILKLKSFLQH